MELFDLYDELNRLDHEIGYDVVCGRDNALLQAIVAEDADVGVALSRRNDLMRRVRLLEREDPDAARAYLRSLYDPLDEAIEEQGRRAIEVASGLS